MGFDAKRDIFGEQRVVNNPGLRMMKNARNVSHRSEVGDQLSSKIELFKGMMHRDPACRTAPSREKLKPTNLSMRMPGFSHIRAEEAPRQVQFVLMFSLWLKEFRARTGTPIG